MKSDPPPNACRRRFFVPGTIAHLSVPGRPIPHISAAIYALQNRTLGRQQKGGTSSLSRSDAPLPRSLFLPLSLLHFLLQILAFGLGSEHCRNRKGKGEGGIWRRGLKLHGIVHVAKEKAGEKDTEKMFLRATNPDFSPTFVGSGTGNKEEFLYMFPFGAALLCSKNSPFFP